MENNVQYINLDDKGLAQMGVSGGGDANSQYADISAKLNVVRSKRADLGLAANLGASNNPYEGASVDNVGLAVHGKSGNWNGSLGVQASPHDDFQSKQYRANLGYKF